MSRKFIAIALFMGISTLVFSAGCSDQSGSHAPGSDNENSSHKHSDHSHFHGNASTNPAELIIRTSPQTPAVGVQVELEMMLHDSQGRMLKDFDPVHEELAHLIIIREGLDEFAHLHPAVDDAGNLRASYSFPRAGSYHVFLDYKPAGKSPATSRARVVVEGESSPAESPVVNVPGRVLGDKLHAEISLRESANGVQIVSFQLQEQDQSPVADLEPFLGATGHLVVLSASGSEYVHAHPLTDSSAHSIVGFEVHFPSPGLYKLWGQFQRNGQIHTIPAVISIEASRVQR